MLEIYRTLAKVTPHDKSVRQIQFQLEAAGETPLVQATRRVVGEVREAAQQRQVQLQQGASAPLSADALTEYYVRRAAKAVVDAPPDIAASALALGLGIALDDSTTLLSTDLTRLFCERVESHSERQQRCRILGQPTLRRRRDLAQHFFISAYLTAVVGAPAAEAAGLAKEIADSRSSSGFSYRDLAADAAGIEFARRLLSGRLPVAEVASRFRVDDQMPNVDDLPEEIPWEDIRLQLHGSGKGSVADYRQEINRRIGALAH